MKVLLKLKSTLNYLVKHINVEYIEFLLVSIKAFFMEFIKSDNPFKVVKKKPNGISVLLATQNEELIVKLSILSFINFADEIIVVDNGSIDNTKEIVRNLSKKNSKIKFFDKPEFSDLYQNRQFTLSKSTFRWICRFDSDFVAYTDGKNNILQLRKILLNLPRTFYLKH